MKTWSLQDAKARFSELVNVCRKDFLLSAPRVDLDISRPDDRGRDVEL